MTAQPSLTRIVNRAAVLLGTARRITSLDENSPVANAARDVFDDVRDELMAAAPWGFARKRAMVAASTSFTASGYARAFEKPADCLRWLPWSEIDADYNAAYEEGGYLLSDAEGPLAVRYIARIEDPSKWTAGFIGALAAAIALEIAPVVTGSEGVGARLTARLEERIAAGKRQDGLARGVVRREPERGSRWLRARGAWGRDGQYGPPVV